MASKPGPLCQGRNPVNINDGTLCAAQTPKPGIQGDRSWIGSVLDGISDDANWVEGKVRDGALWAGTKAQEGATWAGNEVHAGATWAEDKAHHAYHYVADSLDQAWKNRIQPRLQQLYQLSLSDLRGIRCLLRARQVALDVLDSVTLEETGYELASILGGVVEGLIDALIKIGVITLIGGAIGAALGAAIGALLGLPEGGVGAIPGAVAGGIEGASVGGELGFDVGVWYVTILGLVFLVEALKQGFTEMYAALKNYVTWAWGARDMGPALQKAQVQRAGKELARAYGIFMRFLLLALILYITKKALELGGGPEGEAKGLEEATDKVGRGSLGPKFARWFKENYPELKRRINELKNKGSKRPPEDEAPAAKPPASRASEEPPEKVGPKTPVASELEQFKCKGVKPRVRPGTNGKVAVIGRGMDNVHPYAEELRGAGYDVETFEPSDAAQRQWSTLQEQYSPNRIPPDVAAKSQIFQENQGWANKLRAQGYTVSDIDNPDGLGPSPFYDMETQGLFGDSAGGGGHP